MTPARRRARRTVYAGSAAVVAGMLVLAAAGQGLAAIMYGSGYGVGLVVLALAVVADRGEA